MTLEQNAVALPTVLLAVWLGLGAGVAMAGPPASRGTGDIAELLDKIRAACGYARTAEHSGGLLLEGDGEYLGTPAQFSLMFTPEGRFVRQFKGRVSRTVGFDGETAWVLDDCGAAHRLVFSALEEAQLPIWIVCGRWLAPDAPVVLSRGESESGDPVVHVRLAKGRLKARLVIDGATWRPRTLIFPDTFAPEQRVEFAEYKPYEGAVIPRRITFSSAPGAADTFTIRKVGNAPSFIRDPYAMPPTHVQGIRFERDAAAEARLERTWTGHVLVHPRVNGRDLGRFILDTGASSSVIDRSVADAAGLPAFGKTVLSGAGEKTAASRLRQSESFTLGPVTIKDLVFRDMDVKPLTDRLKQDVAGVIGYDLFARCVAEIDLTKNTMALHSADGYELKGGEWQDLMLHRNHPLVPCKFEGERQELFLWDTGAGNHLVLFNAPAARRLGLLDRPPVAQAAAMGVGGATPMKVAFLEWLELAGHRFDHPMAILGLPQKGALNDPYIAGIIGNSAVAPFRVVLNYPAGKIALVKRD